MASDEAVVRPCTRDDVSRLTAMMCAFYAESDFRLDPERAASAFAPILADPRLGRVLLAVRGGEPAGYAVLTVGYSMEFGGTRGFVDDLYVDPAHRRVGVGGALLDGVARVASEMGVKGLLVEVGPGNATAKSVYRRSGFEAAGREILMRPLGAALHEQ